MMELTQANWLAFALALVIGLLVAWWLFARASRPAERSHRPDVLDEGAAPAARNQALIDAPSATAAALAATGPDIFGGIGEISAVAAAEEVAEAAASEAAHAAEAPDELTRIKGVGPKLAALLTSLGVVRYAQIAAWDEADLTRIDAKLGAFAGRPRRDNWVEQARFLAAGDTSGFEGKFGKL